MSNNILDSRDLEQELVDLLEEFNDWKSNLTDEQIHELAEKIGCAVIDLTEQDFLWEWDCSEGERITAIRDLKEEIYGWKDGVTFVKDSYFEEFAEDEADQLGLVNDRWQWPYNCIDWSKAADQLKDDYSSVEFDGLTYWYKDC